MDDGEQEETSLEVITTEQKTLKQKLDRLEKENRSLTSYNKDLRDQVSCV